MRNKENYPIHNNIKWNKIPWKKCNLGGKRMYTENYKTTDERNWREINEKIIHAHGWEELIL